MKTDKQAPASGKKTRRRYTKEFKKEALLLADKVSISKAARQLDLSSSQLYNWRLKSQFSEQQSTRESTLTTENAWLKRQLAEKEQTVLLLKKASAYFARDWK